MPQESTTIPIRDFKDLDVWKAARELRKEIYKVAKTLPGARKVRSGITASPRGYIGNCQHRGRVWTVQLPGERAMLPASTWLFMRSEGPPHDLCGRGIREHHRKQQA